MIVGDMFRVRFGHRLNTQEAFCIWHYVVTSVEDVGPTQIELANQMGFQWGQWIGPCMTTAARFDGLGVQEIRATGPRDEIFSIEGAGPGTGGVQPLPQQVSGVVKLRTGDAGRAKRGRKYIPFPDASANSGNPLEGTTNLYRGNVTALMTDMMGPFVVAGQNGSASLYPVLDRVWVAQPRKIIGFDVRNHWGTQRRRGLFDNPDAPFPPAL